MKGKIRLDEALSSPKSIDKDSCRVLVWAREKARSLARYGGPFFGEPTKNTKLCLLYASVPKSQEENALSPTFCEITIRNIEISMREGAGNNTISLSCALFDWPAHLSSRHGRTEARPCSPGPAMIEAD